MHVVSMKTVECNDLFECSFTNWYEKFQKISIESTHISLDKKILYYLLDEKVILPKECYNESDSTFGSAVVQGQSLFCDKDSDNDDDDTLNQPEFPEFSKEIENTIAMMGGAVFIKTNWKCPKDAYWITAGQTLCCKDISDVYQLLKASSDSKEDLLLYGLPVFGENNALNAGNCKQCLVLKKWQEIHPGTEFRCFVRNKRLVAISPRDWPQYHEYIGLQRTDICCDIVSLFKEHIKSKFPLNDYTFDVVRKSKDQVYLLDFAPFGKKYGDSFAFSWDELMNGFDELNSDEDDPEFRYLFTDCGIQPTQRNNFGIPKDLIDFFSEQQSQTTLNDIINLRLENVFLNQPEGE